MQCYSSSIPPEFDWPSGSKEVVSTLTSNSFDVRSLPYNARSSCSLRFILLLAQSFSAQVCTKDSQNLSWRLSLFPLFLPPSAARSALLHTFYRISSSLIFYLMCSISVNTIIISVTTVFCVNLFNQMNQVNSDSNPKYDFFLSILSIK